MECRLLLEERLCRILTVNEMQFGFIVERGAFDILRILFIKWKEAFEMKGIQINLWKCIVMVSGCIIMDGLS